MVRPKPKDRPTACYWCQATIKWDSKAGRWLDQDGNPHTCRAYLDGKLRHEP